MEDFVKKKLLTILLCGIMAFSITGCGNSKNEFDVGGKSNIEVVKSDVSLSLKKGTLTNTSATFILKNDSNIDIQYGNPFSLEIKQNGEWHEINVELNFTMPAYVLKPNESKEFKINFENTYGKLSAGEYRFIKSIDMEKEDGTYETFYVAAEFTMEQNQNDIIGNSDNLDFYITKPENHNDIRFNDYYTTKDNGVNRTIYLAGNIEDFYIKLQDKDITLKTYLSTAFQTLDDGIKSITDELKLKETLKDGGTKIYKSKEKDITIVACNTTKNDKNIFIGDYSMEYREKDCKN